jgi:hypothetical protein
MTLISTPSAAPNIAITGTLAVLLYYALAWLLWARSPRRGPVVVRYEPPDGMSAAAVRYLWKGGFDERGFTAAILSLAVHGVIRIDENEGSYFINPVSSEVNTLTGDEKALAAALAPRGFGFELNPEHRERIYHAISALKVALDHELEKKFLVVDSALLAPGICGSVLLLLYLTLTGPFQWRLDVAFLTMILVFWSQANAILLMYLVHYARSAKWFRNHTGNNLSGFAKTLLFALPFFIGELALLGFLVWLTAIWFVVLVLVHILLVPAAHLALRNTSKSGRAQLDQIEGFRRFLSEVETDPLTRSGNLAELQKPEVFEKYLPFALALDVQEQWARRFENLVAANSVGEIEISTASTTSDLISLDLTAFGLFVQKWFPFDLGEIKLSLDP